MKNIFQLTATVATAACIVAALTTPARAGMRADKTSEDLRRAVAGGGEQRVIVTYVEGLGDRAVDAIRGRALRGARRLAGGRAIAGVFGAADLEALSNDPAVERISPDRRVAGATELDPGVASTGTIEAFDRLGLTGKNVTVAVVDSGISAAPGIEPERIVASVDFTEATPRLVDARGHGTHVAGLVGASGANGAARGVAPGVRFVSLRALDGEGVGYVSDVIDAIEWAITNRNRYGIRIVNLSLGHAPAESWRTDPLSRAVSRAWASGLLVVVSAGNRGRDGYMTINSPGNNPFVLTVAAMNDMETVDRIDDVVTTYSSRGPSYGDHVLKPDLAAPGNRLVSALAPNCSLAALLPDRVVGPGLFELSGTSQAAGVVSGIAALLLERNPSLTNDQIKSVLMRTADSVPGADPFTVGAGYVNLPKALFLSSSLPAARFPTASPVVERDPAGGFDLRSPVLFPGMKAAATTVLWDRATGEATVLWDRTANESTVLWDRLSSEQTVLWDRTTDESTVLWADTVLWDLLAKEDTALWEMTVLWEGLAQGDTALWTDTVLWDRLTSDQTVLWADTVLWDLRALGEQTALWEDTALWTDTVLWEGRVQDDTALWTDTALWADTVLWE